MNKMKRISILLTMLVFVHVSVAQDVWKIESDYSIEFSGTGAEGSFKGLNGLINFSEDNLSSSKFNVSLNPATIATGNSLKDQHAKGDSWFNINNYDKISFESVSFQKIEEAYLVKGNLYLHGTTKPISIPFTFKKLDKTKAVFEGKLIVNRQDYGIEGPWMGFVVGDEFEVLLKIPVSK